MARINGTVNDDYLEGSKAADTLQGLDGDDTLDGSMGGDRMLGGDGNDTYYVDNDADAVIENANEGYDTVYSLISYTLPDNAEVLELLSPSNDGPVPLEGTGNILNNGIFGNDGNNTLSGERGNDALYGRNGDDNLNGGAGNDYLDGGTGADTLIGGDGDDTYIVDNKADVVSESPYEGDDRVESSINYTLGDNIENLQLSWSGPSVLNLKGTGNVLDNSIWGNDGKNILDGQRGNDTLYGELGDDSLYGQAGNDSLDGGAGRDKLEGGKGHDIYVVDNKSDKVIEKPAEGSDTVESYIDYALPANVEILYLNDSSDLRGTGNAADNFLFGNDGNNVLRGLGGNDRLSGGWLGNDTLIGGGGKDQFVFEGVWDRNIDTILDFEPDKDTIGLNSDMFTSLAGLDSLSAGNFNAGNGVTAAGDADDYLIYDTASGALYYDADGSGGEYTAVQFAVVVGGTLRVTDIMMT